jgi:hypothetical protein
VAPSTWPRTPSLRRIKVDRQSTLWEALLPPALLRFPPGLSEADQLLDDPVFFEPIVPFFRREIETNLDPHGPA